MFQPSLSSYFHTEDEGSKKAGVRFRTTGIINYIQMTTLLRDKGLESLILEASRTEILCKQISDYRTGTAPIVLQGHSDGHNTVLVTSTKGSYSGTRGRPCAGAKHGAWPSCGDWGTGRVDPTMDDFSASTSAQSWHEAPVLKAPDKKMPLWIGSFY